MVDLDRFISIVAVVVVPVVHDAVVVVGVSVRRTLVIGALVELIEKASLDVLLYHLNVPVSVWPAL